MSLVGADGQPLKGMRGIDPEARLAARKAQDEFYAPYRLTGDRLLVRMMEKELEIENRTDADGPKLILPDSYAEAKNDAMVLAVGPGLHVRDDQGQWHQCLVWADVGDRVLVEEHKIDYFPQTAEATRLGLTRMGVVHDSDVAAYIRKPYHRYIEPANGWLILDPPPRQKKVEGMIHLVAPEEIQVRPYEGVVLDFGPGRIRVTGPKAGQRRSILEEWGLSAGEELRGHRVYWTAFTEVVEQTGDADELEAFLINVFPDEKGKQVNTPYAISTEVVMELPRE